MALQWLKQPDGTLVLWDPSKGSTPMSAGPADTGRQAMPGTDTSDVARRILEDKQGTAQPSPIDWLTSKDLPEAPPTTGNAPIDFNALINAFLQKPDTDQPQTGEGGQSLGTAEGATPVTPTTGEEVSAPVKRKSSSKEQESGAKDFVQGMIKRGWSPEEAAGAAGNVHVESGFRPGIQEEKPTAGRGGYGLIQLTGARRVAYEKYAADTGRDLHDPNTQMDWLHMERTGDSRKYGIDERAAYQRAFAEGGSPQEIAARFGKYVERPKDLSQSVDQRMSAAAQYIKYARTSPPTQTPVTQTAANPLTQPQPFSNQTMDEEMFASILGQGSTSWG